MSSFSIPTSTWRDERARRASRSQRAWSASFVLPFTPTVIAPRRGARPARCDTTWQEAPVAFPGAASPDCAGRAGSATNECVAIIRCGIASGGTRRSLCGRADVRPRSGCRGRQNLARVTACRTRHIDLESRTRFGRARTPSSYTSRVGTATGLRRNCSVASTCCSSERTASSRLGSMPACDERNCPVRRVAQLIIATLVRGAAKTFFRVLSAQTGRQSSTRRPDFSLRVEDAAVLDSPAERTFRRATRVDG